MRHKKALISRGGPVSASLLIFRYDTLHTHCLTGPHLTLLFLPLDIQLRLLFIYSSARASTRCNKASRERRPGGKARGQRTVKIDTNDPAEGLN